MAGVEDQKGILFMKAKGKGNFRRKRVINTT